MFWWRKVASFPASTCRAGQEPCVGSRRRTSCRAEKVSPPLVADSSTAHRRWTRLRDLGCSRGLPPDPSSPRLGELCLEISEPSSLWFCSSSCYSLASAGEVLSRFCRCRVTRRTARKGLCTLLCRVIILCGTRTTCWVLWSSSMSARRSLVISGWSLDPSDSIPSLAQRPRSLMVLRHRRR